MSISDAMLDLLDHGCDGEPRWVTVRAPNADAASLLVRTVSEEAERRGYVPLAVERLPSFIEGLTEETRHRTLTLVQMRDADAPPDASALVAAAAINPRPHVLVTIAIGHARSASRSLVREARSAYTVDDGSVAIRWSADAERFVARGRHAFGLARRGRHAQAERTLRESAAALARRREAAAAGAATMLLGRLLLERGRAEDAAATFAEAVTHLDPVDAGEAATARVWVALARSDAGRLTEAEGLLRATRLAGSLPDPMRHWADAALARCLLWQQRVNEAAQLIEGHRTGSPGADPQYVVPVLATSARVYVALGQLFEAGQRARAAMEWADRSSDPGARLMAGIAQLRVLAAAGDTDLVTLRRDALIADARAHHLPLFALRVRLVWLDMLRQAGRSREAGVELERCGRLARAAPALLKRLVHLAGRPAQPPAHVGTLDREHGGFAVALLRLVQDDEDDHAAIQKALGRTCDQARAGRVELQTAGGGVLTTIASSGSGLPSRLGQRGFESGLTIGPELRDGVWQAAAPVRAGQRVVGVLTCRWPLGREAIGGAGTLLELAAAVIAPRVEVVLATRAEASRASTAVPELIGDSEAIEEVRKLIARAAAAPFAVLVEGESGAGKELVARAIHHLSPRRDRRFCDVNCAALPDDLVEAELFGHAKGAFTGALIERKGLFEEANGGTLFLDELPDLSLRSQAKLLRVLQQGEIRRVGESFARKVDVRVVTATNRPMADEVAAGRFRQDLLYRLDVLRICIPPLRDRPGDIPLLAQHFWESAARRTSTKAVLSHGVLSELSRYPWPGNVRELQNVMAALAVSAPGRGLVKPALLPPVITGPANVSSGRLVDARRQFERRFIEKALARAGGSRTKAAAQLGVSRQGLLKLMSRVGVRGGEAQ